MSKTSSTANDSAATFASLSGIPPINFGVNVDLALRAGRKMASILAEVVALRHGPGKLTSNEYFYYRLWETRLSREEKRYFVGKHAQHAMHMACNSTEWYAPAADKLLFHTMMEGAGLPTPPLLAITQPDRHADHAYVLRGETDIATFLRDPANYPLFAKPIDGKFSLSVLSADRYDPLTGTMQLRDRIASVTSIAHELASRANGYLIQRRLNPHAELRETFGSRLWSMRLIVLLTGSGPVIHRAVCKIATGRNPADNFWRNGNMLGAVHISAGTITRVVRGTGAELVIDPPHPDTGQNITGTQIPNWQQLTGMTINAARLLPGIRTQSWDIALTDAGPVPLEVNFGGDLNLSQLASGQGVLDNIYRAHLLNRGYKF